MRPDNLTVWKPCEGFLISHYGAVIGPSGRLIHPFPASMYKGRYRYYFVDKFNDRSACHFYLHRLVVQCFASRKKFFPGCVCDHKDNNRNDNSIYNLQLVSPSYNSRKSNKIITKTKFHYYVKQHHPLA